MQLFKESLRSAEDQAIFEDLLNQCKIYASAASTLASVVPEVPMMVSMLFSHHKKLWELEKRMVKAGLLPEKL